MSMRYPDDALITTKQLPAIAAAIAVQAAAVSEPVGLSAATQAVLVTTAALDPLQPRGLTARKLGVVLPVGTATFETWLVESANVIFDAITQQFVMVYVGYSTVTGAAGNASVGMATSLDGVNWTRTGTALLQGTGTAGDPDQYGTTGPSLFVQGGIYYLFYIGLNATGYESGTKRMMLATATSLTGAWTRLGVIIPPSGTGFRSTAIYHRSIVKRSNGTFVMFFNALGNGGLERIGYATATAITGPWTVDDVNSPLLDVGAGGSWDSVNVGDPSVYRVGDMWYMAYYGFNGANAQDGVAFTTTAAFPLGWTKHPQNPILKVGAAGSLDDVHAHKPSILQTPGAIYHYYTAVGDGQTTTAQRSIAMAIDAPASIAAARLNPRPVVDNFTRTADSSIGLDTAESGHVWQNDNGVWRHVSNHAEVITLGAGGEALASLDCGFSDGRTSMLVLVPASAGSALGLVFRMTDAMNFIWVDVQSTGIALTKRVNGADSAIVTTVTRTIAAGDLIEAFAIGLGITVKHNGVTVISAVSTFATAGTRRGLRNYSGGGAQVDDFTATPLSRA